jgi:hypothetical protein
LNRGARLIALERIRSCSSFLPGRCSLPFDIASPPTEGRPFHSPAPCCRRKSVNYDYNIQTDRPDDGINFKLFAKVVKNEK